MTEKNIQDIYKLVEENNLPGFTILENKQTIILYNISAYEPDIKTVRQRYRSLIKSTIAKGNDGDLPEVSRSRQFFKQLWVIGNPEQDQSVTRSYQELRTVSGDIYQPLQKEWIKIQN